MGKTEVENLILVVEGDIGKAKSIPPDSLRKELARVVAQDGFLVYQTPNLQVPISPELSVFGFPPIRSYILLKSYPVCW